VIRFLITFCVFIFSLAFNSLADDSRPLSLQIIERQAQTYWLQWTLPPTLTIDNQPQLILPSSCQRLTRSQSSANAAVYRCEQPLAGATLRLEYPKFIPSFSTIVTYKAESGEQHTEVMEAGLNTWQVPLPETHSRVAKDYTVLGVQHIWAGTDHLLFLLCLMWIAGTLRRVVIIVTGFTIAHSITLVMSALELIRLPVPPVEAVIALSIVFLAREIAKGRSDSLTWRYPLAVSSSFGLVHGLGFAAVLAEIGLPQTAVLTGLLFFNIGVELGQLAFVLVAMGLYALIAKALSKSSLPESSPSNLERWQSGLQRFCAYGVGGISSLWLIERVVAF